jgi:hypothetical protein
MPYGRETGEWDTGHIEGAFFFGKSGRAGSASNQQPVSQVQYCEEIIVYNQGKPWPGAAKVGSCWHQTYRTVRKVATIRLADARLQSSYSSPLQLQSVQPIPTKPYRLSGGPKQNLVTRLTLNLAEETDPDAIW